MNVIVMLLLFIKREIAQSKCLLDKVIGLDEYL